MSNETVQQEARGTVFFGRKTSDGNYGATEAGVHVQFSIPDGVNTGDEAADRQLVENIAVAFATAADAVLNQLGIDHKWDPEQGRVVELAPAIVEKAAVEATAKAFSGNAASSTPPAASPAATSSPSEGSGDPQCPDHGAMYDNRSTNAKRKAEGKRAVPNWRCKAYKPEDGGCEYVVWK